MIDNDKSPSCSLGNYVRIFHNPVASRLHDHFYATRSESEQRIVTQADSNQSLVVSKQSSDSSVIYLGTFRKIPELINLEDTNDDCRTEVARRDEIQSPKFE
ncbi:unnamed protein product, partial [Heterotrigona itama]